MDKEKVPTGLFYMYGEGENPVFLLVDHLGELFLIQKEKMWWCHKTDSKLYSLFVADGVNDFIDAGEDMFSYRRSRGLPNTVISHDSFEDLQTKLKCIYGDEIRATSKLVELSLDYQTGKFSDEKTLEIFSISINIYEILLSSLKPPTLPWHLTFADVTATFPNTDFPCKVLYSRDLEEFIKICEDFQITTLPGGGTIEDLIWFEKYQTKMILVDPKEKWINNTVKGLYEDLIARVIRISKTADFMNIVKKLRLSDDNNNMLHFYGWQEESDYFYLAFEMCDSTLQGAAKDLNFTGRSNLGHLIGIAKGVFSLEKKGIIHGNLRPNNIFINKDSIPKLGVCRFVFEEEKDEYQVGGSCDRNMQDLAKILLHCLSGGSYTFSDQKVGEDELGLCKMVEARDLIKKIMNCSISTLKDLLHHTFFWKTIKRCSFLVDFSEYIHYQGERSSIFDALERELKENKVYEKRWDSGKLNEKLLKRMEDYRVFKNQDPYNFEEGRSLVRFVRNAFNHHDRLSDEVYEEIGYSKVSLAQHFELAFPGLLFSLHQAGRLSYLHSSSIPNSESYYVLEHQDEK